MAATMPVSRHKTAIAEREYARPGSRCSCLGQKSRTTEPRWASLSSGTGGPLPCPGRASIVTA